MSKSLPYSVKDVNYDNAKFRHRSLTKVLNQTMLTNNVKRECLRCSTWKFLVVLMLFGVAYLMLTPSRNGEITHRVAHNQTKDDGSVNLSTGNKLRKFFQKPPRLPPRLTPDEMSANNVSASTVKTSTNDESTSTIKTSTGKESTSTIKTPTGKESTSTIKTPTGKESASTIKTPIGKESTSTIKASTGKESTSTIKGSTKESTSTIKTSTTNELTSTIETAKWVGRQQKVREAFVHAWSGYKRYAMGSDELMPLSKRGNDGLGGLGATIVDALDTAMIMGVHDVVSEAGSWIETHLAERISQKGEVNLFETTIRVLGGLLSAYHLSGQQNASSIQGGPKPSLYLEIATSLADRLLYAFTSSPTPIPFSDVVLRDKSAHPAPDGMSSTSEVSTLQLEFNYLSEVSGNPKYSLVAMKVLEHIKTLPKLEGLVPIYISPHTGEFSGNNIRLGSRGDSYYEYLLKVWLQQGANNNINFTYLYNMYEEAMKGVRHLLVQKTIPNGLVFVGELPSGAGGSLSPKMDHLVCFLPGTLALGATKGITKSKAMKDNLLGFEDLENLRLAEELAKTCVEMYSVTSTGLAPEIAYFHFEDYFEDGLDGGNKSSKYINDIIIKPADRHNLLRPETVESLFVLYRITEDPKYREWGWQIFEAFEKYTKVDSGGYTSLDDVTTLPPHRRDKMETFFLGETLKYIYLLFGDSNVVPLDKYVFNTEAHPIPITSSISRSQA